MLLHALARTQLDPLIMSQASGATKCRALYSDVPQVSIENTVLLYEFFKSSPGPATTDFLPPSWYTPPA